MNSLPAIPVGVRASLSFHCPGCARELFVGLELAGVEGPCPSCGSTVRAPVPGKPDATPAGHPEVPVSQPAPAPAPEAGSRRAAAGGVTHNGLLADGVVDQRQVDRKEGMTLLKIVLAVALVLALCAAVVLALKLHFSR